MPESKWPIVKEYLPTIERWVTEGITEKQICKNLDIAVSTFYEYKKKYPELQKALKRKKQIFITEIVNALAKRAKGFEYEETKTYIKKNADGEETVYQEKTKKYYPPDVAACSILLKNKDVDENNKAKWSDNPGKLQLDRELHELKKQIEELKLF